MNHVRLSVGTHSLVPRPVSDVAVSGVLARRRDLIDEGNQILKGRNHGGNHGRNVAWIRELEGTNGFGEGDDEAEEAPASGGGMEAIDVLLVLDCLSRRLETAIGRRNHLLSPRNWHPDDGFPTGGRAEVDGRGMRWGGVDSGVAACREVFVIREDGCRWR